MTNGCTIGRARIGRAPLIFFHRLLANEKVVAEDDLTQSVEVAEPAAVRWGPIARWCRA